MEGMVGVQFKGIIFDMDNTLLSSRIDFPGMKAELLRLYQSRDILPDSVRPEEHTVSTLIEAAKGTDRWSDELETKTWKIVTEYEKEGLREARLEDGVRQVLETLHGRLVLSVLTNNSRIAALTALRQHRIVPFFQVIVGREQMDALKPSPSGIRFVLSHYTQIPAKSWLCVGDSWIDGMAAQSCGVPFLAYRADRTEMAEKGVRPIGFIEWMEQLLEVVNF